MHLVYLSVIVPAGCGFWAFCFAVDALCELAVAYVCRREDLLETYLLFNKYGRMHRFDAETGESPFSKKKTNDMQRLCPPTSNNPASPRNQASAFSPALAAATIRPLGRRIFFHQSPSARVLAPSPSGCCSDGMRNGDPVTPPCS